MNLFIVVEGELAAKRIYECWIPYVNPTLSYVDHISQIEADNFAVLMGGGQPRILNRIYDAINDVNTSGNIDRLIIALDSEQSTFDEKYDWVYQNTAHQDCIAEVLIIVQHFCLEAWALGNMAAVRPNSQDPKLREYKDIYDVRVYDPELLPPHTAEDLNRAQFAEKYLRRAILDSSNGQATYNKRNSTALLNEAYFNQLRNRLNNTGHISSFQRFLTAFI